MSNTLPEVEKKATQNIPVIECPNCGYYISALQGSKDAQCTNCGFKLPCCSD